MRSNKRFSLLVLLVLIGIMMANMSYARGPLWKRNNPPKPVLPKPTVTREPMYQVDWDNLGENFVIEDGTKSIKFPLDPTRVVDGIGIFWTTSGKNVKAYLFFDNDKVSQYFSIPVFVNTTEFWCPTRKAKSFRIKAEGGDIRLYFVHVTYKTRSEILALPAVRNTEVNREFREKIGKSDFKLCDFYGAPLKIKANSYSRSFKIPNPDKFKRVVVRTYSPAQEGTDACVVFDNEKPDPATYNRIIGDNYKTYAPKKLPAKHLRVYSRNDILFLSQIMFVYK